MSAKINVFLSLLSRYKYIITIVVGVAVVGFIDDNSLLRRFKYDLQISELRDEIKAYNQKNEAIVRQLRAVQRNPKAIEKIARERYFMKADDEDIFVLSTDRQPDAETGAPLHRANAHQVGSRCRRPAR